MDEKSKKKHTISKLLQDLQNTHYPAGPIYQRLQKYSTVINLQNKNELKAVYGLVNSHSPSLRFKAALLFEEQNKEENAQNSIDTTAKDTVSFKCSNTCEKKNIKDMLETIKQMPKEWTLVQLTHHYNVKEDFNEKVDNFFTNPLHISVFKCGQTNIKPFVVIVDAPRDPVNGTIINLCKEMAEIIRDNIESLNIYKGQTRFHNQKEKKQYLSRREAVYGRIKGLIEDIQNLWLREWRSLLSGTFINNDLERNIFESIDSYFTEKHSEFGEVTQKNKTLITYLVKATSYLKLSEIRRALEYCFPHIKDNVVLKTLGFFIVKLGEKYILKGSATKKHPLILVLDDCLDYFPWEMIDILLDQPVSRAPSLHFVYTLFKEHESAIVDGHIILTDHEKGSYIVNPDQNLEKMEVRMMDFFNYWTPKWKGIVGRQPTQEEFTKLVCDYNIFSYNGHGSGCHLLSSIETIAQNHIKSVVFLSGCNSTKLSRYHPQVEMHGPYHMYLMARCPNVVGNLWEVTDTEADAIITDVLSLWIPSKAVHWRYFDKDTWKKGNHSNFKTGFGKNFKGNLKTYHEPELLKAVSVSKKSKILSIFNRSSIVSRGLPIKIKKTVK